MSAPISMKLEIAEVFERYAAETCDADLRRAATALRGQHAGRKQIDDDASLAEMLLLVDEGLAVETAARHVAATVGTPTYAEQTARRLARKFRAAQNKLSAAQNILSVDLDSSAA
jgi:hypothetical protein